MSSLTMMVQAQNTLSGNVMDKTSSKPIAGSTINILSLQDSTLLTATTNNSGVFSYQNLKNGKYQVYSNHLGFKKESQEVIFDGKPQYVLLRLEHTEIAIEEIEISASPTVKLKGDTMEFDAKKFATREFAESDELVAQIPGILIDEDGNVTAHGETVTKVIVDGKEFFSTDPRIALKTLPAEIIAKIQLIDEKSEQSRFSGFDDGKRNKVINIVTKPDKRNGYFGKGNFGKGDSNKFGANVSLNTFEENKKISMNFMANNINETNFAEQGRGGTRRGNNNVERGLSETYAGAVNFTNTYLDKKMEASADYNFKSLGTLTNTTSLIEYLSEKQANQFRNQVQYSDILNKEHRFGGRVKWDVDSTNRIDFTPNFAYTQSDRTSNSTSETNRNKTDPINSSIRGGGSLSDNFSIGGSLTYMHRFNNKGRTATINISGNKNSNDADGLNLATTSYYRNAVLSRIDTNNNKNISIGHGSGYSTKLTLSENISARGKLQGSYNFRNTSSYSNRETYEFLAETGQLGELKDRLSNEFNNDFNYHSAGVAYVYNKKDSLRFQVGLNYQHGIRNNDRIVPINLVTKADFSSVLPDASLVYKFRQDKSIEFNYNTQTNTPEISQLQDFVNNQNELRITNGNPNLDQEYAHNIRFQYKDINKVTGRSLTTNASFEYVNNKIINAVTMTDTSIVLFDDIILGAGGQYTAPINVNGYYAFRVTNSYGVPIKKLKTNFNANTRLYLNNELAQTNGDLVRTRTYGFNQALGLNSNFSKTLIIGLHYNIDARFTQNPLSQIKQYNFFTHRVNTNVSAELFKKVTMGTSFLYLYNSGILGSAATETTIWNAHIGYKLLRRKNAEIALKGFDLLNNAQNISRRASENSISDVTSNTLNRYFLLSFTYNLRQFGSGILGNKSERQRDNQSKKLNK